MAISRQRSLRHWTPEDVHLSEAWPVRVSRFVRNRDMPPHDHEFWEVSLIAGGTGIQETDAGQTPLSAGSAIVVRPGAFHDLVDCRDLDVVKCLILPSLLETELSWLKADRRVGRILRPRGVRLRPTAPRTFQLGDDAFRRCMALLEPVAVRLRDAPLQHKTGLVGRMLALLDEYAMAWEDQFGEAPEVPAYVQRAARLLEERMDRSWTMDKLAGEAYSSPAHLSRQFSKVMGLPPMAYLARLRIERAAALLRTTDLTVKEVGRRVGFRRTDYFIPRFLKYFDLSPGEYRKRHGR